MKRLRKILIEVIKYAGWIVAAAEYILKHLPH